MIKSYFERLSKLYERLCATNRLGEVIPVDGAAADVIAVLKKLASRDNKVMLIGNGGSSSIASHIAIDLLKNAGVPALAFNDAAFLTCLSNDLGYESVFQKPIEMLAKPDEVLVAVSSSGRSKNILSAALEAQEAGVFIVTLSGFDEENPLRSLGDVNFYVPSRSYGDVEITHLALLHCMVDALILSLR